MNKLKFKVLSPSIMVVFFNEKELSITGEATVNRVFYADSASIKRWLPPFEHISVTESEKQEIIRRVTEETKNEKVRIHFD